MENNLLVDNISIALGDIRGEVEENISRGGYGIEETPVEIDPTLLISLGTSLLGFGSTFLNFLGQAKALREQKRLEQQRAEMLKELERLKTQRTMTMIVGGIAIMSILVGGLVVIKILTGGRKK